MIQSIARALDILEFLAGDAGSPKTPYEIAKATGLNPATVSNIIKTLLERNYVEQAGPRKGYVPGVMCCYLSKEEFFYSQLVKAASAPMEKLAEETGDTVLLAVLKGGKRYILHQLSGNGVFHVSRDIVLDSRVTDTATGLVLISELSESEISSFAAEKGLKGAEFESFREFLAGIRNDGLCVHKTHSRQVAGIAYPIRQEDKTVAALGLFLPVFRFRGAHRKNVLKCMRSATDEISRNLLCNR